MGNPEALEGLQLMHEAKNLLGPSLAPRRAELFHRVALSEDLAAVERLSAGCQYLGATITVYNHADENRESTAQDVFSAYNFLTTLSERTQVGTRYVKSVVNFADFTVNYASTLDTTSKRKHALKFGLGALQRTPDLRSSRGIEMDLVKHTTEQRIEELLLKEDLTEVENVDLLRALVNSSLIASEIAQRIGGNFRKAALRHLQKAVQSSEELALLESEQGSVSVLLAERDMFQRIKDLQMEEGVTDFTEIDKKILDLSRRIRALY